jgi:hypothetical protein
MARNTKTKSKDLNEEVLASVFKDNRFIVDYTLEENREGFYLQVASTPLKT